VGPRVSHFHDFSQALALASAFGSSCGDPDACVPMLVEFLADAPTTHECDVAAVALWEIAARQEDALFSHASEIAAWASQKVEELHWEVFDENAQNCTVVACCLLGLCGEVRHKGALETAIEDTGIFVNAEIRAAAESALNRISGRNQKVSTSPMVSAATPAPEPKQLATERRQLETTSLVHTTTHMAEPSDGKTACPGANEIAPTTASSTAVNSDRLKEEQFDLRDALRNSMQEVGLLRHAPRVRKWRLVGCQADTMLALAESEHLRSAVTAVVDAGCKVLPTWANGALMLVPATEQQASQERWQLRFYHILVRDEDLKSLSQALHDLTRGGPQRGKPALRPEEDEPNGSVCYLDLDEKVCRILRNSQWELQVEHTFVGVLTASSASSRPRTWSAEGRFSIVQPRGSSDLDSNFQ
jgi:hypothetical protein